jgi:hypothetical protein
MRQKIFWVTRQRAVTYRARSRADVTFAADAANARFDRLLDAIDRFAEPM